MAKDNQTMKFGQTIKSYTECGEETILRYFSKKSKLSISLDLKSKVLCSLYLLYAKLRTIETKLQTTCFYLIESVFKKNRKRSGTSLLASLFS